MYLPASGSIIPVLQQVFMENNVLIIAGMHRSGTSLITQWLHRCGLHVGENLLGKGIGNDDGHFEDMEFYQFHLQALRSRDLPESGFVETPAPGFTEEEKERLKAIIGHKNQLATDWGWKDPRTCLYLNDYNQLLPSARYLVIFRDFRSTVSSLLVRMHKVEHDGDTGEPAGFWAQWKARRRRNKEMKRLCRENAASFVRVWMLYNREILKFIPTISPERVMLVHYQSLIDGDYTVFSRLRSNWQMTLSYVRFRDVYKPSMISKTINVRRFIDDRLYREASQLEALLKNIQIA